MVSQIFVNLPVKDLAAAKRFFMDIGFAVNEQFTDENAACIVLGEHIFAMLLTHEFFGTFTKRRIANTETVEVLNGLQVSSREEVDGIVDAAIGAGAREQRNPYDHGWMYGRAFEDLDGHIWEFFFMDETKRKG